ncbi:MAG: Stp1/IreP family PP2C-type Ser/Thr phosphatase [Firmicutes bacterium]|nr:Stp1/IreP family PP2C-type Ser/Thr phosphatase [Bacillota bacterium]
MLQLGMKSDLGQMRSANEDSYLARTAAFSGKEWAILAIADGVGGHRAGDVASRTAINCLEEEVLAALREETAPLLALEMAIRRANRAVYDLAVSDFRLAGMGTTLTAALLTPDELFIGHVGDSRLYLYRDGICRQLTNDHSLVSELVRNGELSPEEARVHPQRNVLLRAVGIDTDLEIDLLTSAIKPDDIVLIASDGLFSLLDDATLAAHLATEHDLQAAAEKLVASANELGGHDNISVVLARWGWSK